ncbi:NAD(P)H-dependent oxidoreductase [Microlunatus soli]|uniref:Putative NADPH-quinone reductase (Modulator of drug activity B) n=1 Tax=Microlunatus soli TaxID=630515 RepID=A0A1H1P7X3_9ACTN|nr:NAD(P)H-dependent oxidoreductase [Microlunatus soli]SDS07140.1 Putative NADPH-quinone reductase (modulator of drug activity B) [Microlunatus soli]
MNVLTPVMVVLAHPRANSLDHELAGNVRGLLRQSGVRQTFHDLYAESFDPVLTEDEGIAGEVWTRGTSSEQVRRQTTSAPDPLVDRHRRELAESRALVVIHPDWWGKPPAILTGWLDRVLLSGPSPGPVDPPAPNLRRVLVINTSDQEADGADAATDPLGLLWREQIGPFLRSPDLERLTFRPVAGATSEQRARWFGATQRAAAWVCGAAR